MVRTLLVTAALSGLMISDTLSQSTTGGGAGDSPKFVASQSSDQWVFSKFKGTDVVGPNDENIGSVNDLLFDRNGKVLGVMVGVGGFLGIGQKNVAIEMGAFQVVPGGSGSSTAAPLTGRSNDPTDVKLKNEATRSDDPTYVRLKVAWTKDQIQQAPDFQYYKPPAESPSTTGLGQRPRPKTPVPEIPQ